MHLNIINTAHIHDMCRQICTDIRPAHRTHRQLHGQQVVGIAAKSFPVEEIAPPAHHLSQHQAQTGRVCQQAKGLFSHSGKHKHRGDGRQHTAVDGQTAVADIENAEQIVLVHIPGKHHIVHPGADDGQHHGDHGQIQIHFRILARAFCLPLGQQHTADDADANDDAVIGNGKAADGYVFAHMLQVNSQMGKIDIPVHRHPSLIR